MGIIPGPLMHQILRAHRVELSDAPSGGILQRVRLTVRIQPSTGAALIYGGPPYAAAARVQGPQATIDLPTAENVIYVQMISGAQSCEIGVEAAQEDTGRTTVLKGAPLSWHKLSGGGSTFDID